MVDRGVKIFEVISKLSSYEYIDQIKYKELVYRNLVVNKEKRFAYSTLTLKEIADAGIDMEKVFVRHSDLIKFLIDVDFTFVISETDSDPKYFEVSFRSKGPDYNVKVLAEMFGGGGHVSGAGAKLYSILDIHEALTFVLGKLNI
jgi:nanoRNase/pAp phosphatase (c-di-AMP/oligoRNAs hydrolase)